MLKIGEKSFGTVREEADPHEEHVTSAYRSAQ